jgi:uroporphyrinogen-III synthase
MPEPGPLVNRTIALPETRQLDVLAELLERRGATTVRCPLVAILDAPDPAPIEAWLKQFIADPCDDFVILTGEGLRRLLGFADRAGIKDAFIAALTQVRKVTRGPKPGRALHEIGLKPDLPAEQPTTEGVIATLTKQDLHDHKVAVQLYGTDPNKRLIEFLKNAGATPRPVAPYIYASKTDDQRVLELIQQMAAGKIDVIAFTSTPQYRRLRDVAKSADKEGLLINGLERVKVAAIGPVVAEELKLAGVRVDLMPVDSFFMKPLVTEIVAALGNAGTD